MRAAGLDTALSGALARWRSPFATHDPAKVLLDLAITMALGGDTCSGLTVVCAEPVMFGQVASDRTASRTIAARVVQCRRLVGWGRPGIDPAMLRVPQGSTSRTHAGPHRGKVVHSYL